MKAEHRIALLAMAARRGEKDITPVLAEAIDAYLAGEYERSRKRNALLSLKGSLSEEEGEELRAATRALRENWR